MRRLAFRNGLPLFSNGLPAFVEEGQPCGCCGDPCAACVAGTFAYTYTATLAWPTTFGIGDPGRPDLDLYTAIDANPTVYFGHLTQSGLTLNYDVYPNCGDAGHVPPEIITGSYAAPHKFHAWYNQYSSCAIETAATTATAVISNTGTGTICVNGQNVAPGCSYVVALQYAGYSTGALNAYAGTKTTLTVASGCC